MIDNQKLGDTIRWLRRLRRLRQADLAEQLHVSVNYVSLLENGHRGVTIPRLNVLADVLRVPSEYIVFLASAAEQEGAFAGLNERLKELIRRALNFDAAPED